MHEIKVKRVRDNAVLPTRMTEGSSGFDVYSCITTFLTHLQWECIPLGISLEMPSDFECQIRSRSGLAAKRGVMVLNGIGTIDQSFTGELQVILMNFGKLPFEVKEGDRIAQVVFCEVPSVRLHEVSEIRETERGSGGFGSTGV